MQTDFNRFSVFEKYRKDNCGWTPLRCITKEGWILAAWVWKKERYCCKIGLFLVEDHQMYVEGAALNWALRSIFTQALYQVGSMEIRFEGNSGASATLETGYEPRIPEKIRSLAGKCGIKFRYSSKITHEEARELYFHVTGFPHDLMARFQDRQIDPIWPCVLVQRDIWTEQQIEYIFKYADSPERIFRGEFSAIKRLAYIQDRLVLRQLILAERLTSYFERLCGHNERPLRSRWESASTIKYDFVSDVQFRTLSGKWKSIAAGKSIDFLILPRTRSGYLLSFRDDCASWISSGAHVCVTRDYETAHSDHGERLRNAIVMNCFAEDLDQEIDGRLRQTATNRAGLLERQI